MNHRRVWNRREVSAFIWGKPVFVTVALFLLRASFAFARAGGAGGGDDWGSSSSSHDYSYDSSDDDLSGIIFDIIFRILPFEVKVVLFGGIIIFIFVQRYNRDSRRSRISKTGISPVVGQPLQADFESKVRKAFVTVQNCWSEKNPIAMRRFITDGIYQRFNAQFKMMDALGQSNPMSDVTIHDIRGIRFATEGLYEIADVRIEASAFDQFRCEKFPELDTPGGRSTFVEYWSFLRKKERSKDQDIYSSEQCPQCGAPLDGKLLETARCPYCQSYLNGGEFDWVLSEITQEEAYEWPPFMKEVHPKIFEAERTVQKILPGFSKQLLEDNASNAFMQILLGVVGKDKAPLQRFSTQRGMESALAAFKKDYLFDRLYLRSVELVSLTVDPDWFRATIGISYDSRRVLLTDKEVTIIDTSLVTRAVRIEMVHKNSASESKGSIYANACPHCGATQKDSLHAACEFCHGILGDTSHDWLVDEVRA